MRTPAQTLAWFCRTLGSLIAVAALTSCNVRSETAPLTVAVMDPLAAELACACVGGYAQRDYHALGAYLGNRLERPVTVVFGDNLDKAVRQLGGHIPDMIVGKESVVRSDARESGAMVSELCRLTGPRGEATQQGFFVVKAADPAQNLADLMGRAILFGPADSDEKHSAAIAALDAVGVPVPKEPEVRGACSDGAIEVADSTNHPAPVAVISSYALPLLEGCGSIDRGDLRVVGETRPVPFITLFINDDMSTETREALRAALLALKDDPKLLRAMESRDGFLPWVPADWTDWRGPNRDGHVDRLPEELPDDLQVLWKRTLPAPGLAGPAATQDLVVLPERDPFDERDVFRCFRVADGETVWSLNYEAKGCLDYGNSPRATPVIIDDKAYLLGGHGELHCVKLGDGTILWKKHLVTDLDGLLPVWGYCSTPLAVDDTIVVNPGGIDASFVALNRHTGEVLWRTAGGKAAYGSPILGKFGGRRQIVGYDAESLGGWDPRTGERLWSLTPPVSGDFNVPTPIAFNGNVLVATENNGTRIYGFSSAGRINADPVAINKDLAPETCTPVLTGNRLFGCGSKLRCLDVTDGLKEIWCADKLNLGSHSSLIATATRLLIISHSGELLLIDVTQPELRIISRTRVFDDDSEIYAHAAVSHGRLFVRDDTTLLCLALE